MAPPQTLTTPRLRLRAPADREIEPIFRACQDPDIQRFTLVPVRDIAPAAGSSVWTIEIPGGELVGTIGLRTVEKGVASLGYWCAPSHRGHRYLTEALAAVLDHAFADPADGGAGFDRVIWRALVDNVASARLAASAGFRYTGRRPEDEIDQLPSGRHVGDVHTAVLRAGEDRTQQSWNLEQSDSVRRDAQFLQ
ncbi:GNAT family N-acetyltransferase [Gordonia sp. JH63]|uniref:GNAT family N-acetyltransferase n=1 Tax=Gordonia sp. JH63 TaxID=2698900 RepID=UPI00131F5895|nr:GNAT family N-acetyltransferase [Gordonia sp. JH63]QHD85158.1 GNAT family N-acetyltransferase [Gordonia sp. JH63]